MVEIRTVYRRALLMSMVALLTLGLTGCLFGTTVLTPAKVAVLLSGNFLPAKAEKSISVDTLASLNVTIDSVTLEQEDGTLVSVLPAPVDVDLVATGGIGGVLSAADIPAGVYVGGTVVISSATVEFLDNPGVLVPVSLPSGGAFDVEVEFELVSGAEGVLTLTLDDIEIDELDDASLALSAELKLEAETNDGDEGEDGDQSDLVVGDIETDGVIDDLESESNSFEMEIGDGEVEVDYSAATILLPPTVDGGDPVPGTVADLAEDACVHVTGTLAVADDDLVLTADTILVTAYDCDEDDDDFNEYDDDSDDEDEDDSSDDDGGDDDNGEDSVI